MKKFLFFVAAAFMAVTASAQQGQMAVGGNLYSGSGDSFSNLGIGAKFQYGILDQLRAEASFNYFFKKDHITMTEFNANAHYLFTDWADGFTFYPLAGLSYLTTKASYDFSDYGVTFSSSAKDSDFGLNLGFGAEYALTENLAVNAEAKYRIASDWKRFIIGVGVSYKF